MDEAYAKVYGELARTHWWWRARDRAIEAGLNELVLPERGCRILDVGCGDGRLFTLLERFGEVSGLEPDPNTFGAPPPDPRIRHTPFVEPLPFDGPFDLVTLFDVLEHLEDPVAALRLVAHSLRPGGIVFVTVPAFRALWTNHDVINHHRTRYAIGQLQAEFRAAGLTPTGHAYHFQGLVISKLLSRLRERVLPSSPVPPARPHGVVNAAVERWFGLERRLMRPFRTWLPGTSLFAIGAKASD
ncbi:MAG TPA: class I SAM-dependent methyltransferase [Gemmatimonadales bacterium]|nr:class I SAM-dependent methyltransferase [Gemmatimonadales bacterium]